MMTSELLSCPFCGGEVTRTDCDGVSYLNSFYCEKCPVEFTIPHHTTDAAYVAIWNTRSPPELPPVCPEDLVEGELYAVRRFGHSGFEIAKKTGYLMLPGDDWPYMAEEFEAIYGPLRFKIGGAS